MTKLRYVLLSLTLFLLIPCAALAQIPDMNQSTITTRANQDVSVMICPLGDGTYLSQASVFGGGYLDATIEIYLKDYAGNPVVGYPGADIRLEGPGLVFCVDGNIADHDTDADGYTEFAISPRGSGCMDSPALQGYVSGTPFMSSPPLPHIRVNSPDMNTDGVVNLTDVVLFARVYFGAYSYCADFYWDGVLNLSDIVMLSQNLGHACQ